MKNIIKKICFSILCISLLACTSNGGGSSDGPKDIKVNSKLLSAVIVSSNHIDNKPLQHGKISVTVHYAELSKIVNQNANAKLKFEVKASDNGNLLQINNDLKINMNAKEDQTLELPVTTVCKNDKGCDNGAAVAVDLLINSIKQEDVSIHYFVSNRDYYFSPSQAGAKVGDDKGIVEVGARNVLPGDSFKILLSTAKDVKILKVDNIQDADYCEISSEHKFCKINYAVAAEAKIGFLEHAIQANISTSGEVLSFALVICAEPALLLTYDTTVMTLDKTYIDFTVTRVCTDNSKEQPIELTFNPDLQKFINIIPSPVRIDKGKDSANFQINAQKLDLQYNIADKFTLTASASGLASSDVNIDNRAKSNKALFILKDAQGHQVNSIEIKNDSKKVPYTFNYYGIDQANITDLSVINDKDEPVAKTEFGSDTATISISNTVKPGNYKLIVKDTNGAVGINSVDNFYLPVTVQEGPISHFKLTPDSKNLLEKLQSFYYVKVTKNSTTSSNKIAKLKDDVQNLSIYPEKPGVEGCAGITITKIDVDTDGNPTEKSSCKNVKIEDANKSECSCALNETGEDLKDRCIFRVDVANTFVNSSFCNIHVKTEAHEDLGAAIVYSDSSKALPAIKVVADTNSDLVRTSDKFEMWSITSKQDDLLNSDWFVSLSKDSINKLDTDSQSIFNPDIITSLPAASFGYNEEDKAYEIYNYPGRTSSKAILPHIRLVAGIHYNDEEPNPFLPVDRCSVSETSNLIDPDYRYVPNLGCDKGGFNGDYRGKAFIPAGISVDKAGISIVNNQIYFEKGKFAQQIHEVNQQDSFTMKINMHTTK
jgi:hypothetical protein